MKFKFKWFEKKADERQERELMQVEHIGFWFMYWMLLAAIVIQAFVIEGGTEHMMGEFIVFMLTSVVVLIGWAGKGVWSYHTRKVPGVKAYLGYSLIAALALGISFGILDRFKRKLEWQDTLRGTVIMMVYTFILSFVMFCIVGTVAKKREEKLSREAFYDEDEEEL